MTRELRIDLEALKWLRAGGDNLTPETQLRDDVRMALSPAPTGGELSDSFNRLEARQWALASRQSEGDDVKWMILPLGKAQLTSRNL